MSEAAKERERERWRGRARSSGRAYACVVRENVGRGDLSDGYNGRTPEDEDRSNGSRQSRGATDFNTKIVGFSKGAAGSLRGFA